VVVGSVGVPVGVGVSVVVKVGAKVPVDVGVDVLVGVGVAVALDIVVKVIVGVGEIISRVGAGRVEVGVEVQVVVGSSACAAKLGKMTTHKDKTSPARINSRAGREKRATWVIIAPCDPDDFLYYSEIPMNVK
jgi:hypothetical protein